MKMTNEELEEYKRLAAIKYKAQVAEAADKLPELSPQQRAVIDAIFPGYRESCETLMDVSINHSAIEQADKVLKELRPWLVAIPFVSIAKRLSVAFILSTFWGGFLALIAAAFLGYHR